MCSSDSSGLESAILNFYILLVRPYSNPYGSFGFSFRRSFQRCITYKLRYALCHFYFRLKTAIFDFRHIQTYPDVAQYCHLSLRVSRPRKHACTAIGISFLCCPRAELVLPVWRTPFWTSNFRLGLTTILIVSMDCWTSNTYSYRRLNFVFILSSWDRGLCGFGGHHLGFLASGKVVKHSR